MSEELSQTDDLVISSQVEASDHSDVDSDVINDWTLVSNNGELQDSGDESSSLSGSSIEVMSLEDDLEESSRSSMPPISAEARTPMFILRVPSTEAALKALSSESDESDESEPTDESHQFSVKQHEAKISELESGGLCDSPAVVERNKESPLDEKAPEGLTGPGIGNTDEDVIESTDVGNSAGALFAEKPDLTCNDEIPQAKEEPTQIQQLMTTEDQASLQANTSFDMSEAPSQDVNSLGETSPSEAVDINPEQDRADPGAVQDNDNIINEILEEDAQEFLEVVLPAKEVRYDDEPEQQDEDVPHNDFDVVNRDELYQDDQRYYYQYDIQQDDPETESSTEMDIHDDRIESDQSDLHTTDNSNLSNVDISDMMENIHVNRQYLHHPNPWIDVCLNTAIVLVVSVAIGMGIGHNLGSAPSWKIGPQRTICHHKNVDDFIRYTILDQKLDRCERKLVAREETLTKRYQKLFQENQKLKDEANVLKNEVYDLRSEVIRLKYRNSQEVALLEASQKFRASVTAALIKTNQLEQENSDLRLEIGRLKYGYHSNQKIPDLIEAHPDDSDLTESAKDGEKEDLTKEVKSLKNELDMERERSEMWKKLYQDKVEETKTEKQTAENTTMDMFGCMKLVLKNLSLPVNISEKFEEKWRSLQNVSLTGFMDVLKSFVHSEKQNNGSKWSSGNKKGQTRWSDTVNDVLNKTKASVNEVTQQIQDTWKQVKNLSNDLWRKHEPTLSRHLKKVQERMYDATQHLKDTIHKSKWFNKKKNKKNHHQDSFYKTNDQKKASYNAKTKRRSNKEDSENRENQKHDKKQVKRRNRKINKQMKKLHNKMQHLNAKKFEKLNCKKQKKTLSRFENIEKKFGTRNLHGEKQFWFDCQKTWWFSIVQGRPSADVWCKQHLFGWQVYISDNCYHCHKKCQENDWKRNQHSRGHKKHRPHSRKPFHDKKKQHVHQEKQHYRKDTNGDEFHRNRRENVEDHRFFYQQSVNEASQSNIDDILPGLVFPKEELEDITKRPNITEEDEIEEYDECDPDLEVCQKSDKNWYLHQMDYRKFERQHDGDDGHNDKPDWMFQRAKEREYERNHHRDDHGKTDWMFKRAKERDYERNQHLDGFSDNEKSKWVFERAEDREFERNQPDDWYFRRSDEWNKQQPQFEEQEDTSEHLGCDL